MALRSLVALTVLLASCGIPRDPEGTLDRVEGGVMRVGITENEPWTVLEDSEPQGVEVDLIEAFARQLGAEIDWTVGAAEEVLAATEEGDLDLAIGGFLADDPWATRVSFIQPYATVGEDQH